MRITKCDFCTVSKNGKCPWKSHVAAEPDCEKAIKKMVEALKFFKKDKELYIDGE